MSEEADPLDTFVGRGRAIGCRDGFFGVGEYSLNERWAPVPANVLSTEDRRVAVETLCRSASGSPADAAIAIRIGIAVLDGRHAPVMVWPFGFTEKERFAWLIAQAGAYSDHFKWLDEHAAWLAENAARANPQPDSSASIEVQEQLLPGSASTLQSHAKGETESPLLSQPGGPPEGSSDTCLADKDVSLPSTQEARDA